jgi:hypothetical protein
MNIMPAKATAAAQVTARTIDTTASPVGPAAGPVSGLFFPFPARPRKPGPKPVNRKPLSARMIGFFLHHADMETDMGGGRVALSFSPKLLNSDSMRARLGFSIGTVRQARVIWNPATGAVLGVRG